MKAQDGGCRGFTLIEMLVVITVIGILTGMVFQITSFVNRSAVKAETKATLNQVAMALNEFRAEYGIYPPVQHEWTCGGCGTHGFGIPEICPKCRSERYRYDPETQRATGSLRFTQRSDYEFEDQESQDSSFRQYLNTPTGKADPDVTIFRFGMLAYLLPRSGQVRPGLVPSLIHTNDYSQWIADTPRDLRAKRRWWPHLEKARMDADWVDHQWGNHFYTNLYTWVEDGWNQQINYRSDPPYSTYDLWSSGTDGRTDRDNPDAGENKDDVHCQTLD